ncbi:DNA-formamidopyrimidine glycosylase family protein [Ilumatobacter nonamiensis]|uniref:DNA-formamidopyrimidine glycosylase family protein n=1 Tax=Ilumatobacter nonamiensis TaxID=467093 RepID=UPI000345C4AE|nr:DNA-formamidopyrimidine glycosylase family protein [Ilumatobacter nonamiensis]
MPEGLEAEIWTRAAQTLVGRTIERVWCDQRVAPPGFVDLLNGSTIGGVWRRGKVVLVETDGPTLGLHFGMTGRLEIDGAAPITRLEYASNRDRAAWDRLRLWTKATNDTSPSERPALRMNDPRRLGRLSLDPDLSGLGADCLTLSADELIAGLGRRSGAIKPTLLDQAVVAGLGNLCADEVLFHAGVAPRRPADSLTGDDIDAISEQCRLRLPVMLAAGGSTHGDLSPEVRAAVGACPLDGAPLDRTSINGRTAVWCPAHQR